MNSRRNSQANIDQGSILFHQILFPSMIILPLNWENSMFLGGFNNYKAFLLHICVTIFAIFRVKYSSSCSKMLYFPNTLPAFAKMIIGFHNIYRRMWKNIYPCLPVMVRIDVSWGRVLPDPVGTPVE